jgi:hypothetical protein
LFCFPARKNDTQKTYQLLPESPDLIGRSGKFIEMSIVTIIYANTQLNRASWHKAIMQMLYLRQWMQAKVGGASIE